MRIVVASSNPVKIAAAKTAFERCFGEGVRTTGVAVSSDVADQPMDDAETLQGARNRARNALRLEPNADFWVGIEGGIIDSELGMECTAWVVILGANGQEGKARSASFFLPPKLAALIRGGMEQGAADDHVFGRENSGSTNGTVGYLTKDHVKRAAYYTEAVTLALVPFLNPEHYPIEATTAGTAGRVS